MKPELGGSVPKKTAQILNFEHEAVELCLTAMNQCKTEKDMAMFIKKEFDKRHGGVWHCVIGKHFGCYISHEKGRMVQFFVGEYGVLLYKSGFSLGLHLNG
ncbi:hypothetical protein EG68_04506 [Paragonimus skrjabini miyazakii]|uniref:Dynein light chain n=1 Tax=Paragonimus skrjabini miyazakii TaxID=59628 RepID=A0A8S9Z4Z5_9TREM|nr:hypothetical protein EG68_04506 [Paragonimus skrjabini miyazakii]